MNTIQHYHNPSLFISIEEAKEIILDLIRDLKGLRSYYRRNPEYFTEKQKEKEQEKEVNTQHELCYYETLILRSQEETPVLSSNYGLAHVEVSNNNFYGAGEHLDDKDPIKIKITQIIKLMAEVEAELQAKL